MKKVSGSAGEKEKNCVSKKLKKIAKQWRVAL